MTKKVLDQESTVDQGSDVGQEPLQTPQEAPAPEGQGPERYDEEYVRKLRAEAAGYRKRLRELEERVRQHDEEKLSETERLQARLAEAERELARLQQERQERALRYEVMLAASRLNIVDPEAAFLLLDPGDVEYDDSGSPTNVESLLRKLISKRPYLAGGSTASATNPARSAVSPPVFTRSQLRDPEFFRAHRDEIMRALKEGRITEG